jgi:hypothetical protein
VKRGTPCGREPLPARLRLRLPLPVASAWRRASASRGRAARPGERKATRQGHATVALLPRHAPVVILVYDLLLLLLYSAFHSCHLRVRPALCGAGHTAGAGRGHGHACMHARTQTQLCSASAAASGHCWTFHARRGKRTAAGQASVHGACIAGCLCWALAARERRACQWQAGRRKRPCARPLDFPGPGRCGRAPAPVPARPRQGNRAAHAEASKSRSAHMRRASGWVRRAAAWAGGAPQHHPTSARVRGERGGWVSPPFWVKLPRSREGWARLQRARRAPARGLGQRGQAGSRRAEWSGGRCARTRLRVRAGLAWGWLVVGQDGRRRRPEAACVVQSGRETRLVGSWGLGTRIGRRLSCYHGC